MKNMLKWHENVMIFPLKFSQDFNGFGFCSGMRVYQSAQDSHYQL